MAKVFTDYCFMRTYAAIAHSHILSLVDFQGREGNYHITFEDEILQLVRLKMSYKSDKTSRFDILFGVILRNGTIQFLERKEPERMNIQNEDGSVFLRDKKRGMYKVKKDLSVSFRGKIKGIY